MDSRFHIDFDWLGPADSSDADRVTFAALSIRVGDRVATRVLDSITKAECHSTHISAFRLAIWFAANWWRLRWEPEKSEIDIDWEMSHKMGAVGGGYLWPNLTVSSDGEEMIDIHSRRTRPSEYKLISYLDSFRKTIPAHEFERGIDEFVEATIARSYLVEEDGQYLSNLWAEVQAERNDPAQAAWRKLEAMLGFDPGEAPPKLITTLQKQEQACGQSAVEEVAVECSGNASSQLNKLLKSARSRGIEMQVPETKHIRKKMRRQEMNNPSLDPMRPRERAYQAAAIARKEWNLKTDPISSDALRKLLGISKKHKSWDTVKGANSTRISTGLRNGSDDDLSFVLRAPHPDSKRFALARLIGDHLNIKDQQECLLPVTKAKTVRQRFQGAFAQELLCPIEGLREYFEVKKFQFDDRDDIQSAAEHFKVSTQTVGWALVNGKLVDQNAFNVYDL